MSLPAGRQASPEGAWQSNYNAIKTIEAEVSYTKIKNFNS